MTSPSIGTIGCLNKLIKAIETSTELKSSFVFEHGFDTKELSVVPDGTHSVSIEIWWKDKK